MLEKETFYIRFVSPNNRFSIFSWAIKIWQWWFDASHVQLEWFDDYYNQPIVYEASGTSIHFSGEIRQRKKKYKASHVFEIRVSPENAERTKNWCFAHSGLSYDIWGILGFLPMAIARLFGKRIRNPFNKGTEKQFCTELAWYVISEIWGKAEADELMYLTPKKLYEYLDVAAQSSKNIEKIK